MIRLVHPRRARGFTLIEFLVAVGIITILVAILLPYLERAREASRRTSCASQLSQIGRALSQYARDHGEKAASLPLPQTVHDLVNNPRGYVAFTGPDDPDPFAKHSAVSSNDITASLWLLVRGGYISNLSTFICPSTSDQPDRLIDAMGRPVDVGRRGNFRYSFNLSYSYASPFTDAAKFVFSSDRLAFEFAVLADKNPGLAHQGTQVLGPTRDAPPFELAKGNSPNHQHAGQNVLHPAGDVSWQTTPYCGVKLDNIYSAFDPKRFDPTRSAWDLPGCIGPSLGPADEDDSYLVPIAGEGAPGK